jgi:DNA-binding LytR/AlgR family response regulator
MNTSLASKENIICIPSGKKNIYLNTEDIIYIEGLKDYVIIRHEKGREVIHCTMKGLVEMLPTESFFRIHRSYIIALKKVLKFSSSEIEMSANGKVAQLPISIKVKNEFMELIKRV